MPSLAKLRRTWFALLKEAGVQDADRHGVQEAVVGKASLRDWTRGDYDRAIAYYQRLLGQHRDRHAHVKEDARPRAPSKAPPEEGGRDPYDDSATRAQCRQIEALCDEIEWRKGRIRGPRLYCCSCILRGDHKALRREHIRDSTFSDHRQWRQLTREEASRFIQALIRQKRSTPRIRQEAPYG